MKKSWQHLTTGFEVPLSYETSHGLPGFLVCHQLLLVLFFMIFLCIKSSILC